MIDRIIALFFKQPDTINAPPGIQQDVNAIDFEDIYEAKALACKIKYSFVANINGQRWRVYPNQSPKLISR